jgi:hypothetical protein
VSVPHSHLYSICIPFSAHIIDKFAFSSSEILEITVADGHSNLSIRKDCLICFPRIEADGSANSASFDMTKHRLVPTLNPPKR